MEGILKDTINLS